MLDSLPQEDQELMHCAAAELEKTGLLDGLHSMMTFKFSDAAFKPFKEHAVIGEVQRSLSFTVSYWLEGKHPFVKVGSNFVDPVVVALYLQMIDKRGDFPTGCLLAARVKHYFFCSYRCSYKTSKD